MIYVDMVRVCLRVRCAPLQRKGAGVALYQAGNIDQLSKQIENSRIARTALIEVSEYRFNIDIYRVNSDP